MKTIILGLFCVFSVFSVFSQDCKYTVDKKDAFTNDATKSIVYELSGKYLIWTSSKKGAKYFVDLTFYHAGVMHQAMKQTDSILVKLENGKIISMKPNAEYEPISEVMTKTTTSSYSSSTHPRTTSTALTYYTPSFEVSKEFYTELSQSVITNLRIDLGGVPNDVDLSSRKAVAKQCEKIKEGASCITALE